MNLTLEEVSERVKLDVPTLYQNEFIPKYLNFSGLPTSQELKIENENLRASFGSRVTLTRWSGSLSGASLCIQGIAN